MDLGWRVGLMGFPAGLELVLDGLQVRINEA